MPAHVWKHVLDVEPNRHLQQLGEVRHGAVHLLLLLLPMVA
jgi:hypothetical protein